MHESRQTLIGLYLMQLKRGVRDARLIFIQISSLKRQIFNVISFAKKRLGEITKRDENFVTKLFKIPTDFTLTLLELL